MHGYGYYPYGLGPGGVMVGRADTQEEIEQLHADIMRFGQTVLGHVAAATDLIQQGPEQRALRQQTSAAYDHIEALPPNSQDRIAAVSRYRDLQNQEADDFNRRALSSPILRWNQRTWRPFFDAWQQLRNLAYQRVGQSPGFGREYVPMMPGARSAFVELQNRAPF
jgi:hypothetical protein